MTKEEIGIKAMKFIDEHETDCFTGFEWMREFAYEVTKELEQKNAELKADNDARKFAMAMSEKVEKQLREENAELKERNAELKGMYAHSAREAGTYKQFLESKEKENAELKEKLKPENCLKLLAKEGYVKFTSEQLTKAKELLKLMLKEFERLDVLCNYQLRTKAENFLKESEVEK